MVSGSYTKEIKTIIDIATSAMTTLARVYGSNISSFPVKVRLYGSLVLSTLLFGCECLEPTVGTGQDKGL